MKFWMWKPWTIIHTHGREQRCSTTTWSSGRRKNLCLRTLSSMCRQNGTESMSHRSEHGQEDELKTLGERLSCQHAVGLDGERIEFQWIISNDLPTLTFLKEIQMVLVRMENKAREFQIPDHPHDNVQGHRVEKRRESQEQLKLITHLDIALFCVEVREGDGTVEHMMEPHSKENVQQFKATGRPILTATSAVSRGLLKRRNWKSTNHFNRGFINTECMFQSMKYVNQAEVFRRLVTKWFLHFCCERGWKGTHLFTLGHSNNGQCEIRRSEYVISLGGKKLHDAEWGKIQRIRKGLHAPIVWHKCWSNIFSQAEVKTKFDHLFWSNCSWFVCFLAFLMMSCDIICDASQLAQSGAVFVWWALLRFLAVPPLGEWRSSFSPISLFGRPCNFRSIWIDAWIFTTIEKKHWIFGPPISGQDYTVFRNEVRNVQRNINDKRTNQMHWYGECSWIR